MHSSMVITNRSRQSGADRSRSCTRGVVTLELLIVLPILVIFLLAVVEFGVILAKLKQVSFASREGTRLAARLSPGQLASGGNVISNRVNQTLSAGGINGSCRVIVQHNVPSVGNPQQVIDRATNPCTSCQPPTDPLPIVGNPGAVRVTVCVDLIDAAPNLLSMFGFSLNGRFVSASTVLPYSAP